jgi:hypothetical protein
VAWRGEQQLAQRGAPSVLARLCAIDQHIEEVEVEARLAEAERWAAKEKEDDARAELDSDLAERLAPFVADRDRLVRQIEGTRSQLAIEQSRPHRGSY